MIEARIKLWSVGIIATWYLRTSQLDVYHLLITERYPFLEAARRFGKTTAILCFVLEKLIQHPGWICRWCFPWKNQARLVLTAEMAKLQAFLPEESRFEYQTTDSVFVHPNGSKLYICGVNDDRGDSARGPAANIIIADEYGFWIDPNYIIREALYPQLQNQEGRWLIKASTPPFDLGHAYYKEREESVRKTRFIQKTIYDNEALTEEELQEIIEECGGVESPSFQRERLCKPVSDPKSLIIPEFNDENIVEDDYPRPQYFDAYVGGDSGADDNTAILFGYYDFQKNEIVIEEELVLNGETTKLIVDKAKDTERNLWDDKKPHRRVYDAGKQLIYDILGDHQYSVSMPHKTDKHAAVHELRIAVGSRSFKIKRKCRQTIWQMKVGMWKDSRHSDFQRSDGLGHLDAIAAAIYFNRAVDKSRNPYPQNYGVHRETHFINPTASPLGQTSQALKDAFGGKSRRFR